MNEHQWDELLRIKTTGRDDSHSDRYRFPYEPTSYHVLERLAGSGCIGKKNVLLDYGCGKGRVDFFLAYQLRCRCIGVEYDDRIYASACRNKEQAVSGSRVNFTHMSAETYPVPVTVDRIYFFNPFSVELLQKVIWQILDSFYEEPREILLFFYYPSDEYLAQLMMVDEMLFLDEIDCRDLFEGNDGRERIIIFRIA